MKELKDLFKDRMVNRYMFHDVVSRIEIQEDDNSVTVSLMTKKLTAHVIQFIKDSKEKTIRKELAFQLATGDKIHLSAMVTSSFTELHDTIVDIIKNNNTPGVFHDMEGFEMLMGAASRYIMRDKWYRTATKRNYNFRVKPEYKICCMNANKNSDLVQSIVLVFTMHAGPCNVNYYDSRVDNDDNNVYGCYSAFAVTDTIGNELKRAGIYMPLYVMSQAINGFLNVTNVVGDRFANSPYGDDFYS